MRNAEAQQINALLTELRGDLREVVILLSTIARNIDDFRYETHKLNRYLKRTAGEAQPGAEAQSGDETQPRDETQS